MRDQIFELKKFFKNHLLISTIPLLLVGFVFVIEVISFRYSGATPSSQTATAVLAETSVANIPPQSFAVNPFQYAVDAIQASFSSFFGTTQPPVGNVVVPPPSLPQALPQSVATTTPPLPTATTSLHTPTVTQVYPIRERVIERVITTPASAVVAGMSEAAVNERLTQLNNSLKAEIYRVQTNANAQSAGNFAAIALTNRVNNLSQVAISNASITNSSFAGSISGTTGSFSGDVDVADGFAYKYNGANVITAQTALNNYFFGGAGNLTGTGSRNIAAGSGALSANTSGVWNTAIGTSALNANMTGNQNVAVGDSSMLYATSSIQNTAVGQNAMKWSTTASYNTAIGQTAFFRLYSGNYNTALGFWAGFGTANNSNQNVTIDDYSNYIGAYSGRDITLAPTTKLINATAIGAYATTKASSTIVLGGTGAWAVNVGIGTSTPAQKLDIVGNINVSAGSAYMYNGANVITASTTLSNYFFGGAGNLTMTGGWNTASGQSALQNNTTGYYNTASGQGSLVSNTTGYSNTASGGSSLYFNTTGTQNTANGSSALQNNITGSNNTASGYRALSSNFYGSNNTGFGVYTLQNNRSATSSTALGYAAAQGILPYSNQGGVYLGYSAGYSAATGSDYNTLLGYQSGYGVSTGARNVLIGQSTIAASQNQVTTGSNNIAIGNDVALASPTASNQLNIGNLIYGTGLSGTGATLSTGNVGIGTTTPAQKLDVAGNINISAGSAYMYNGANVITAQTALNNYFFGGAGNLTMTGANNTGTGKNSLISVSTGYQNTANGVQALTNNSVGAINTANGYQALFSNISGWSNTAVGGSALFSNTTAWQNTAVGASSLSANTTGNQNTAVGASALQSSISGTSNTAVGYQSLFSNTGGPNNTATGVRSLYSNIDGFNNTANGFQALYSNKGGDQNTAIGGSALYDLNIVTNTGVGYNTAIGFNTGRGIVTGINNTILGANVTGLAASLSNNIIIADGAGNQRINVDATGNVGIGTTTPAYTLHVATTTVGAIVARFQNGTGYCDINPTNTALVCTSDETLKKNIVTFGKALDTVSALRGVNFNWNVEQDGTPAHIGFIAQEVEKVVPGLVATDITTGKKSVNYIGFTPILVEAIKELADKVNTVVAQVAGFAQSIHTKEICVEKSDGTEFCANGDQLAALAAYGGSVTPTPLITPTSSSTPVTTAVTLQIQGNNPATINVGDVYGDLGAVITAPASAMNYGIKASLDGGVLLDPAQITVDTKVAGVHHIVYTVVDQAGATTTAERILNVVNPLATTATSTPVVTPVATTTPVTVATTTPPAPLATTSLVITATTTGSIAGLLTASSTPVI